MAKASPALTAEIPSNPAIAAAAADIHTLINSQPRSPTRDELAAIIAKRAAPPTALPALSPEHLKYRKIIAEVQRYDDPNRIADDEEIDAVVSRLQEEAHELETEIWAKPARTLADILLRAEIALDNEIQHIEDCPDQLGVGAVVVVGIWVIKGIHDVPFGAPLAKCWSFKVFRARRKSAAIAERNGVRTLLSNVTLR